MIQRLLEELCSHTENYIIASFQRCGKAVFTYVSFFMWIAFITFCIPLVQHLHWYQKILATHSYPHSLLSPLNPTCFWGLCCKSDSVWRFLESCDAYFCKGVNDKTRLSSFHPPLPKEGCTCIQCIDIFFLHVSVHFMKTPQFLMTNPEQPRLNKELSGVCFFLNESSKSQSSQVTLFIQFLLERNYEN